MLIIDLIKSVSDAMTSINSFGTGVRQYANLEEENEAMAEYGEPNFPRVWLYTFSTEETIEKGVSIDR